MVTEKELDNLIDRLFTTKPDRYPKMYAAIKRSLYLNHDISHDEYYLWFANWVGITYKDIPFSVEQVANSKNEHLSDLPLAKWDSMYDIIMIWFWLVIDTRHSPSTNIVPIVRRIDVPDPIMSFLKFELTFF